ncbi:MAG TPA: phenylalanine--tRNA ligase subunit beta, partial [Actinomycetota bacterium]|nr:phenylalanine--tRNA ligase subunit beta [Actinomycetota bacterium]
VRVRPERATLLLGVPQTARSVRDALARVGVRVRETEGGLEAEVPGWRPDLELEADLIEEVIRVQGYDRVGATLPGVRQAGGLPPERALRERIRRALVRAGLLETTSYSFASPEDLALLGRAEHEAIRVANPLGADQRFLRTSLLPGLLAAVRTNRARQVRSVALFEVGRTFHPGDPVREVERVALALAGEASRGYPEPSRSLDLLDAKGALEVLLEGLGVDDWRLGDAPGGPFHPGRSAAVLVAGEPAGVVGELHPREAERLDLPPRVALAELDVEVLGRHAARSVVVRDLPRFPPVRRDLAFVVEEAVPAGAVREALIEAGGGLVGGCVLFDVFRGGPVPEGRKSLAFQVDLRAPDRTLTDQEADAVQEGIVRALRERFGAELRAG